MPKITTENPTEALLNWYDRQKRDLPWRQNRDPYAVWISEIMLQQTQVSTAEPYFEAFMEAFPTVRDLAEAPIDDVLAKWSGLGYYRRARLLHSAAQRLHNEDREIPSTAKELLELPGIGPYTAAAIASIAFNERVAVLDGNVERVMTRLLAYDQDPKKSSSKKFLTAEALKLVSGQRPGDSNQALMELGATICRPKGPSCLLCPVREMCRGRATAEDFPKTRPRKKAERVDISVAVVRRDNRVLLFKRSETSELLAGMWELPHVTHPPLDRPLSFDLQSLAGALGATYGGHWQLDPAETTVKHSITHRAITFHIHRCRLKTEQTEIRQRSVQAAWVDEKERERFAVSSAVKKILTAALDW